MIRIGTRKSNLAVWQSKLISNFLTSAGHENELVHIISEGDKILDTPIPAIGGKGIFTKALDDALLEGSIDLAVHSFKDIPTELPDGILISAILTRADSEDVLVCKEGDGFLNDKEYKAVIATGSNRRKAQWLERYPNHKVVSLRGNINTRLQKLEENNWDGAIFAKAGLKRLGFENVITTHLEWMISAPAQGAIAVVCRAGDEDVKEVLQPLNHQDTAICTKIERDFLHTLNGGCSAPIGAIARISENKVSFNGIVLNPDGTKKLTITLEGPIEEGSSIGVKAAKELLSKGAETLVNQAIN